MTETATAPVDFKKGDEVTLAVGAEGKLSYNSWTTKRFAKGGVYKVTAVRSQTLTVRARYNGEDASFNIPRSAFETPNGEVWVPPAGTLTRKIGEVPEGSLPADDPRIAWIFEDAARVAKNWGYCGTFDELADKIGVPGRRRDITVSTKVNGLMLTATVKARSTKEAEALVAEKVSAK